MSIGAGQTEEEPHPWAIHKDTLDIKTDYIAPGPLGVFVRRDEDHFKAGSSGPPSGSRGSRTPLLLVLLGCFSSESERPDAGRRHTDWASTSLSSRALNPYIILIAQKFCACSRNVHTEGVRVISPEKSVPGSPRASSNQGQLADIVTALGENIGFRRAASTDSECADVPVHEGPTVPVGS